MWLKRCVGQEELVQVKEEREVNGPIRKLGNSWEEEGLFPDVEEERRVKNYKNDSWQDGEKQKQN